MTAQMEVLNDLREESADLDRVVAGLSPRKWAPLPGTVGRILVAEGQPVAVSDLLLTPEAMTLEHPVYAPVPGVVVALPVPVDGQVDTGAVLVVIEQAGE